MNKLRRIGKVIGVSLGAIVCSTVAIQATDVLRTVDTPMTALFSNSNGECGPGAVPFFLGSHTLCVDIYEASPSEMCPHQAPKSELQTRENVAATECVARSAAEVEPWRYVSLTQAQQLCARAGKRLPTNDEWYALVVGMADLSGCHINTSSGGPMPTGKGSCRSPGGVHDLVGNVWEWMNETVVDGAYDGRDLPESGYVAMVDGAGVVAETTSDPQQEYGDDYAWVNQDGVRGIARGGFYASGDDAGLFAQNLSVTPDFAAAGIGFRCVQDR